MNLGPGRPRRTHPTYHGDKKGTFAPLDRANNLRPSLPAAANTAASAKAGAQLLDLLVELLNEFVFVLGCDGTIRTIWREKPVGRLRASLLSQQLCGVPGMEAYEPFAEIFGRVLHTGRRKGPEY